jgi:replicative DNA helicase
MKEHQDIMEAITEATIVKAEFGELDNLIDRLHPNELIVLDCRASMDKTALALNVANKVAVIDNQSVLFVSLELAKVALSMRLICLHANLDTDKVRSNSLSKEEHSRFMNASNELAKTPMYIDDMPNRTVADIEAEARKFQQEKDLKLIVIDHLGLITPENPDEPRQEQVVVIVRRLKELVEKLHVSVLCLHHEPFLRKERTHEIYRLHFDRCHQSRTQGDRQTGSDP